MVSGFLTSPWDHSRIFSGDASEMRIALKDNGSLGFSKKLKMSRIGFFLFLNCLRNENLKNFQKRRLTESRVALFCCMLHALCAAGCELNVQEECLEFLNAH